MVILAIVFLVVCAVCAFKESKITGLYKANGVYGRLKAYLALDFVMAGIMMFITPWLPVSGMETEGVGIGQKLLYSLLGLVILAVGLLLYILSYKKCPESLKKKCIPSMIVSGFGVAIKICLFFLPFVWKLSMPTETVTASQPETTTEVWRENGYMTENLKVNSTGDMYYADGEWHKIQK